MKLRWLIVFGFLAFVTFAIVSLPASVLFGFLQSHGVSAAGTQGSVWKGRAQMLQIQGANLGAIEWDLHALALLGLKLKADVTLTRAEGVAQPGHAHCPGGNQAQPGYRARRCETWSGD